MKIDINMYIEREDGIRSYLLKWEGLEIFKIVCKKSMGLDDLKVLQYKIQKWAEMMRLLGLVHLSLELDFFRDRK